MRIYPEDKILNKEAFEAENQLKIDKITRIVAIVVAAASTYFFIIKILFL